MIQTLSIFRSIRTNYKTQGFFDNLACAKVDANNRPLFLNGKYIIKSKTSKLCPVGYAEFYPLIGMKAHGGVDWASWHGEPLYFPVRAKNKTGEWVKWYAQSEVDFGGGIGVDIWSADRIYFAECPKEIGGLKMIEREWNENEGWLFVKFRFWHLKETWIKNTFKPNGDYQWIITGQFLGLSDSTGASSGSHNHEGMKITNDQSWTIDNDNGYYGGVNLPKDSFKNEFILDILKQEIEDQKKIQKIELTTQIIEKQMTLIDLLRQLLSELQIKVRKLSTSIGGYINKI